MRGNKSDLSERSSGKEKRKKAEFGGLLKKPTWMKAKKEILLVPTSIKKNTSQERSYEYERWDVETQKRVFCSRNGSQKRQHFLWHIGYLWNSRVLQCISLFFLHCKSLHFVSKLRKNLERKILNFYDPKKFQVLLLRVVKNVCSFFFFWKCFLFMYFFPLLKMLREKFIFKKGGQRSRKKVC